MSIEQASAFLDDWVNENVHAVAHPKDNTEAMHLASRCLEAAEAHGITKSELEEAAGEDLVKCMCDAQVAVADAYTGGSAEDGDDDLKSD
jgi:hypothetical protein